MQETFPGTEPSTSRVKWSEERLRAIRDRLNRLAAGEPATAEDVRSATIAAQRQQRATWEATERLRLLQARRAHRDAADAHRGAQILRDGGGPPPGVASDGRNHSAQLEAAPDDCDVSDASGRASAAGRLGRALSAILTRQLPDPGADDRRQELWEAVVRRCESQGWRSWLRGVCTLAVQVMPTVRGVAITCCDSSGIPVLSAVSDSWARVVEDAQQLLADGPGPTAHFTRRPVFVESMVAARTRWPGLSSAPATAELTGIWSAPLGQDGFSSGSVSFFRTVPGPPSADEARDAVLLARIAGDVLWADLESGGDDADEFHDEHIAVGVVMEQLGLTSAEAYARVRAHAFARGETLRTVAIGIGERRITLW